MAKRKGATRRCDIPKAVLAKLNAGKLETATLAEGLAVDFQKLLAQAAPRAASEAHRVAADVAFTRRMHVAGTVLFEVHGREAFEHFRTHPSDTVRGWSAFALASNPDLNVEELLESIRPLADDPHFGVREWAWMAVRPAVASDIRLAVRILTPWASDGSERLRRFASEVTRPRGVWCEHIPILKQTPKIALPVLSPLHRDPSLYVRNSVANWLNDAAKSRPDWVREICHSWLAKSSAAETRYICRRACRSISSG